MIGFWLVNCLPPNAPQIFKLNTPAGVWIFRKASHFDEVLDGVNQGRCANTYSIEFDLPTDQARSSQKDSAFYEVLPICLAASFVTGMAVTVRDSLPHSEITMIQTGPHFPRERGIRGAKPWNIGAWLDIYALRRRRLALNRA